MQLFCRFVTLALWCAVTSIGFAQTSSEELSRLKMELARLQEENQQLKLELAKIKAQIAVETEARAKPAVELYLPLPGKGRDANKVIFSWKAAGNTLSDRSVSLDYTEEVGAPWRLITTRLPNEGTFAWIRPLDVPTRVFLRCRVLDNMGKETVATTSKLILIDFQPEKKP